MATLPPASPLTSVDLPTLGRPATATNPLLKSPHPHPLGWGSMPAALGGDDSPGGRTCLSPIRDDCGTSAAAATWLHRRADQLPPGPQQPGRGVEPHLGHHRS